MGTVNALLEATLVGFLAVFFLNVTRYWLTHQVGYWIFLPVLTAGTAFLWIADVGLTGLEQILDAERDDWVFHLENKTLRATTLAVLTSVLANVLIGPERSARLAAKWRGNLIECLMQDSFESGCLVELTLKTGKSYVGRVIDSGVYTSNDSDVSIMPIFSGHRDHEHQLQLTTSYKGPLQRASSVVSNEDKHNDASQFELVLSKTQIVSARPFDPEIFETRFGRSLPGSSAQPEPSPPVM